MRKGTGFKILCVKFDAIPKRGLENPIHLDSIICYTNAWPTGNGSSCNPIVRGVKMRLLVDQNGSVCIGGA
jgi:hypothetical protein